MKDYIRRRAVDIGEYIVQTEATVRQTAVIFRVSKSTVHKDVTERLPTINKELFDKVKCVLDKNKAERHIRGGEVTRMKYVSKKL